eukprot:1158137-Pelagomonas_calceolata.AAC.8
MRHKKKHLQRHQHVEDLALPQQGFCAGDVDGVQQLSLQVDDLDRVLGLRRACTHTGASSGSTISHSNRAGDQIARWKKHAQCRVQAHAADRQAKILRCLSPHGKEQVVKPNHRHACHVMVRARSSSQVIQIQIMSWPDKVWSMWLLSTSWRGLPRCNTVWFGLRHVISWPGVDGAYHVITECGLDQGKSCRGLVCAVWIEASPIVAWRSVTQLVLPRRLHAAAKTVKWLDDMLRNLPLSQKLLGG